jgi:hypothetical protein
MTLETFPAGTMFPTGTVFPFQQNANNLPPDLLKPQNMIANRCLLKKTSRVQIQEPVIVVIRYVLASRGLTDCFEQH